jgi:hypothetical protein
MKDTKTLPLKIGLLIVISLALGSIMLYWSASVTGVVAKKTPPPAKPPQKIKTIDHYYKKALARRETQKKRLNPYGYGGNNKKRYKLARKEFGTNPFNLNNMFIPLSYSQQKTPPPTSQPTALTKEQIEKVFSREFPPQQKTAKHPKLLSKKVFAKILKKSKKTNKILKNKEKTMNNLQKQVEKLKKEVLKFAEQRKKMNKLMTKKCKWYKNKKRCRRKFYSAYVRRHRR